MTDPKSALPSPQAERPRNTSGLAIIAIILSLLLSGAIGAYVWHTNQQSSERARSGDLELRNATARLEKLEALIQGTLPKLQLQTESQSRQLSELLEITGYQAEQLTLIKHGSRADWLLSEAEYLLRLANQRLQLERDVRGSELMLSAADKVLAELDDPALLAARIALAEELLALQSIEFADAHGAFVKMDALIAGINQLPEKDTAPETQTQTQTVDQSQIQPSTQGLGELLRSIWQELKQAIRIQRKDEKVSALITPEQQYYLKQNLRLILEQASLAIMKPDDTLYQSSLNRADDWIAEHFDQKSPKVKAYIESLRALKGYTFEQTLPDISRSLRLVKERVEAMYRQHQLNKHHVDNESQSAPPSQDKSQVPTPTSETNGMVTDAEDQG